MNSKLMVYIANEQTGVWINEEDNIPTIILKASSPIIKSIILGARIEMVIGLSKHQRELSLGLIIFDNEVSPSIHIYPPREECEVLGLRKLITGENKEINLLIFDQNATLTTKCSISSIKKETLEELKIFNVNEEVSYSFIKDYEQGNTILDELFKLITTNENSSKLLDIVRFNLNIIEIFSFKTINNSPNGSTISYQINFGIDGSEGYDQEEHINHALKQIFPISQVFSSPEVIEGVKQRELVDLLAFDELHILAIQSKSVSQIEVGRIRTHKKQCSTFKKKTLEGLNQVSGAVSIFDRDIDIIIGNEKTKLTKRNLVFHLVIVSDLLLDQEGNNEIVDKIKLLYNKNNYKTLVMSLDGFIHFVRLSRLECTRFWNMLEAKFFAAIDNNTVLIRDIDSSQSQEKPFKVDIEMVKIFEGMKK